MFQRCGCEGRCQVATGAGVASGSTPTTIVPAARVGNPVLFACRGLYLAGYAKIRAAAAVAAAPITATGGDTSVRAFRSFGRIRRARNSFEYPSRGTPGPVDDDVDDAVAVAMQVHNAATTILDQEVLTPW